MTHSFRSATGGPRYFGATDPPSTGSSSSSTPDCRLAGTGIRTTSVSASVPISIRCYLFDRPGDASVRVWLQWATPTRVRAGAVQLLRHPPQGQPARIGDLVADFANGHVLPAAATTGVRSTNPSFGPRSAVTPAAEMLFTRLADTADGEWPLGDRAQGVWDELISSCLSEQVAIDRTELTKWLTDSGWEQGTAGAITERFFADAEWLARRLAVTAE